MDMTMLIGPCLCSYCVIVLPQKHIITSFGYSVVAAVWMKVYSELAGF